MKSLHVNHTIYNHVFVLNMLKVAHIVAAFVLQLHAANAECPQMEDIPVMYDEDNFMCFTWWRDYGGDYSVSACNGDQWYCPDGRDYVGYVPMGSIFVMPGCTLYMWKDNDYTGDS